MGNTALQVERIGAGSIEPEANVIFDTTTFITGLISYDDATGVITFNENIRYFVSWQVATQSSASGIVFALSSSQGDCLQEQSPVKTGQVSGTALINVVSAPVTLSLINNGTSTIYYYPDAVVKANLTIIQDDIIA